MTEEFPVIKAVIGNVFADDNRGGAAITAATARALRLAFPGCELSFVGAGAGSGAESALRHTRHLYPDARFLPAVTASGGRLRGLRGMGKLLKELLWRSKHPSPTVQAIRDANIVVSKGGQFFVNKRGLRGAFSLISIASTIILATRWRIPTVVSGATIGPFHNTLSRRATGWILRRVDLVIAREPWSVNEAVSIGVSHSRIALLPDMAFGLDSPTGLERREAAAFAELRTRFGVVTIASLPEPPYENFQERLKALVLGLLDRGVVDEIAIVVQVDGREASDLESSMRFASLFSDSRVRIVSKDLPPERLVALYGAAVFTVGCRLHSTLFSIVAGTPAFPVALGPKPNRIFSSLGLNDYVIEAPDLPVDDAISRICEAVAAGDELRQSLSVIASLQRSRLRSLPELLRRVASGRADLVESGERRDS